MSAFDARKPSMDTLTEGGVRVVVRAPRAAELETASPPEARPARVVITPPAEALAARDALMKELVREHGEFIRKTLLRRRDVAEESTKDLGQKVLVVLCEQIERAGVPENLRGFLVKVIRYEVANHKRLFRPDVAPGADVEAVVNDASDPEREAARAERWRRVARYIEGLSPEEVEVIRCVAVQEMTIEEAAAALNRSVGTVATQLSRARTKLKEAALASDRATEAGERRRA